VSTVLVYALLEAGLASLVYAAVTRLSISYQSRATDNSILNLLLSALSFFFFFFFKKKKKKRWVFKRLPLYEGTAYILLKKRTYTD